MEKIINGENIKNFAYVNDRVCKFPVKGVALSFFGLGDMSQFNLDTADGKFYGERGVLFVVPYTNPWAWMNRQAVGLVDEILDVLFEKFGLGEHTPVISSGGSMGGLSALVYCAYAKRAPAACVANCPVCDAVYHYSERDDLPRTMYSALYGYGCGLEDGLKSISPVHLIDKMPKIKYHIFHCGGDKAVNISRHSDVFVQKMREYGRSVTYDVVPERGHCDIGEEMIQRYKEYILEAATAGN